MTLYPQNSNYAVVSDRIVNVWEQPQSPPPDSEASKIYLFHGIIVRIDLEMAKLDLRLRVKSEHGQSIP